MPNRYLVFFAILLLASVASPQAPPAQPAKPTGGSVSGRVIDSASRQPVQKATILLTPNLTSPVDPTHNVTVRSGEDGGFQVTGIRPGAYDITVSANGYNDGYYGTKSERWNTLPLRIEAGARHLGIDFELVRQGVITGRILNRKGEPVPDLMIAANQPVYPGGKRRLDSDHNSYTNDLGEFRLTGLGTGVYYISALHIRPHDLKTYLSGLDRSAAPPQVYRPTYYPGVPDDTSASPVTVLPGGIVQASFTMLQSPAGSIRGRVLNLTGKADAPVSIELSRGGPLEGTTGEAYAVIGPDGSFELSGIAQGAYFLSATTAFNNERWLHVTLPIEVGDKPIENLELRLTSGLQVPGTLSVDPPEDPAFKLGKHRVTLGWTGIIYAGDLPPFGETNDTGAFTIESVNARRYQASVTNLPPGYYIKSARMGGIDVLESGVTLTDSVPGPLRVVVSPNGGAITGTVTGEKDKPMGFATVALVPDLASRRGQGQWYRSVNADQEGKYSFSGLTPAVYKLFAWERVPMQSWMNEDFLRPFEAQGVRVTVREKSSETRDLKAIR